MIRMIQSKSEGHAKAYFSDELSRSDYYLDNQELAGQFKGKLKERLGLSDLASKEEFFLLCENKNPSTGKTLTPRYKDERTVGYDINFHAPKSVSIVHALSKDDHILIAFQKSVHETMLDIEGDSQTRVRKKGQYADRKTGELVWGEFTHQTARPVEGVVPDPHLHTHCFVMNMTFDDIEKQFKAGQFRDINRDMPYYQARFNKRLSDNLSNLGYGIRRTDKSFEVEGVPQRAIELFSKRTDEIGRIAKEKGITDAKQKSELGARTRAKKQKGYSMVELKSAWRRQLTELGKDETEGIQPVRFDMSKKQSKVSSKDCVNFALQHSFERASVMTDRRLLEQAYRHGVGKNEVSIEEVTELFEKDERIIKVKDKGRLVCTTKEVLAEEKEMVELAKRGQGSLKPLYREGQLPDLGLNEQQAKAVNHVLTTPHQVSIIRGAAGTGKTKLMSVAVSLMERTGKNVTVLAPTAQASRIVLRDEGFNSAETLAKFLVDKEMQSKAKDQIIWLDEAGLAGTRDMKGLLKIASVQNARVILGGDTRQHSSVARGDALRILNTVAGIKTAEVNKIYRQQNVEYRMAVEDLSKGQVEKAFRRLDDIGAIKEIDPQNPNEKLVNEYIETIKKGKSALVISPTHKQGTDVTKAIRDELRTMKVLGRKEIDVKKLMNLNLTDAEKSDWRTYQAGHVVQFNQNLKGIMRGSRWSIHDTEESGIILQDQNGSKALLPLKRSDCFDVYKEEKMSISKGDKLRITKPSFDHENKRLNNGHSLEVISVSNSGEVKLQNSGSKSTYKLDKNFGHWSHDYCVTSHASQGKTVDEVFIAQPAATFPATDAKQFYVSVSRGRERAHIYTDDKEALLDHAGRTNERQSAIELVDPQKEHRKIVDRNHRHQEINTTSVPSKQVIPRTQKDRDYEPGI